LKFLIIIPAHNEEANFSFTLDSLQQQSFKDFKVVVVNDGSTDTTPDQRLYRYRLRLKP
jgi:glycosyltransferase involved in cell wall biosynthesis